MPKTNKANQPIFYVYVLFDWLGVPRYVGYGHNDRWEHHELSTDRINQLKNEFIEQTWNMLEEIPKIKVREDMVKSEALLPEIALIKAIGRLDKGTGPLVNMSAGGEGGDFGAASSRAKARWTPAERAFFSQKLTIGWKFGRTPIIK